MATRRLMRRMAALGLLLAALLIFATSCAGPPEDAYTTGDCSLCRGTGHFGSGTCPSCQGLGYVRVRYSYPVIDSDR